MQGLISARAKTSRATKNRLVPYNSGMERCEQNAEYEVQKNGTCAPTERAKAYACRGTHYEGATFLCHAHAHQAGHKVKNLHEDPELAERVQRVFGPKLSV